MTNDNQDERREQKRDIALYNLRSEGLVNLATSYFAQREGSGFGENDNSSVEQFLYNPSFDSAISGDLKYKDLGTGKEVSVAGVSQEDLERSREGGRRYSGQVNVSEYKTIEKAAGIIRGALGSVKVEDIKELMDSNVQIDEKYQGKYVADLLESEDAETKQFAEMIIAGYQGYLTSEGVTRALSQATEASKGGLEKLLSGEISPNQIRSA